MAGRGKRLRPHTLTVPKPLIPIAGKPIVERLVLDIAEVCGGNIENIGFVIGDFGKEVEDNLLEVAKTVGAKGHIFYQEEALGTAHAVYCAEKIMEGPAVVAFADTLFKADFRIEDDKEGIIWVKQVEDPSAFGVVKLGDADEITDFVEKPKQFVSDLAIIGIYYFKKSEDLKREIKFLLDNKVLKSGEYQLTDALENLKNDGVKFYPGEVAEWLDCGNKHAVVDSNNRYLDFLRHDQLREQGVTIKNSVVIEPVYLREGAILENSVVGPYVSVGKNTVVSNSVISNSVIQNDTKIASANLKNSLIGNDAQFEGAIRDISLGDFSVLKG